MVSDQKWRKLLKKGGQINGVPLPGLPSEELQISTVGSSGGATINEAFHFYLYILDKARSRGSPITRRSRVLDFGVGWGRIIRCFMRETKRLYGVDVQPRFLDAAKETGCPAELSLIEPMGALPFRGGTFDLVYAYSVFTHLPLHVQRHWLSEIRRVMNPSGLFVATVQAPRFLVDIASVDLDDPHLHPWMRALHAALNDNVDPFRLFNEEGYIYFGCGKTYGDIVMTKEFAKERWSEYFVVSDYLDDVKKFKQAVVTSVLPELNKRDNRLTRWIGNSLIRLGIA